MKQKKNNGIGRFDIVKGICMLSVLLFHFCDANPTFRSGWLRVVWLINNSVGIGTNYAFFFISGYRMRLREPKKFFKAQVNEIKGMYCWTAVAVAVFYFVLQVMFGNSSLYDITKETAQRAAGFLLGNVQAFKVGRFLVYDVGPVWFLMATFWAQNCVNAVLKGRFSKHAFGVLLPLMLLVWMFYGFSWSAYLGIFGIVSGLEISPVLYAGYRAKERKMLDQVQIRPVILLALGLILFQTVMFLKTGMDLDELSKDSVPFAILLFIVSLLWGWVLCCLGVQLNRSKAKILEWIATIGRYSSYVLCIHTVEGLAFPWYRLSQISGWNPYAVFFVTVVLRSVTILLGCILMINVVRNKRELIEKLSVIIHKR